MSSEGDSLAIALFGEIAMVDQLARGRLAKALPRGMEVSHFSVLNLLVRLGAEKSPAQLARIFNVTKGAMTNTLGKLSAAGYIYLRPDWDDGRRKFIVVSPAGVAAREEALRAISPIFESVVGSMGSDTIKNMLPFLRELRRQFEND